jgi:hypothetical protein
VTAQTLSLPFQKQPFDEAGKVLVNKEWYLALLALTKQTNTNTNQPSVSDIQLLEAVDASNGSEGNVERLIATLFAVVDALLPQDSTEQLAARLREIEIRLAFVPDLQDALIGFGSFVDEKGAGGTPGFAAGVDFTAGTTTQLTLSQNYGSAANLFITFDAGWQGADQFSLNGRTLTFTSAIPSGISKVFVKGFL